MSWHPSQVTSALHSGNQWNKSARVGGHDFPGVGTNEEKIRRLEDAVVSINAAIEGIAEQVERISRELNGLRR